MLFNNMISPSYGIVGTLNGAVFGPLYLKCWFLIGSFEPICIQHCCLISQVIQYVFSKLRKMMLGEASHFFFWFSNPYFLVHWGKNKTIFLNFPILNASWLKICLVLKVEVKKLHGRILAFCNDICMAKKNDVNGSEWVHIGLIPWEDLVPASWKITRLYSAVNESKFDAQLLVHMQPHETWMAKSFLTGMKIVMVSVTVRLFACPTVHGVSVNVVVCGFVSFWLHISSVSNVLSWYYFLIFTSFSRDLDLTSRSQQYMALKYTVVFWASSDLFMFILYTLLNYMGQVVFRLLCLFDFGS